MAIDLYPLQRVKGFLAGSLVDANSGMLLAVTGQTKIDMIKASAGQAEVLQLLSMIGLDNKPLEDILFTFDNQYHIIRPLSDSQKAFLYVVLDRAKSNLGMARSEIKSIEALIKI